MLDALADPLCIYCLICRFITVCTQTMDRQTGLIYADSTHVNMGTSGRHAGEAFISTATNEPYST